ncbi:MAG: DUF4244 domain-containing protein [Actinomycetaceae bacterium]|nr:DUF4244 domain-containing protein [Actinomycetaceae bacterium]
MTHSHSRTETEPRADHDLTLVKQQSIDTAEDGLVTAEYAVGIMAAVAFAGVLLAVVKSNAVKAALAAIIQAALTIS